MLPVLGGGALNAENFNDLEETLRKFGGFNAAKPRNSSYIPTNESIMQQMATIFNLAIDLTSQSMTDEDIALEEKL